MEFRKIFLLPRVETDANPEPYTRLVDCIEDFLEVNETFVGDLDGDPSQRGMLIDTEVGKGTIVILDGGYRIVLQGPAKIGLNNDAYHICRIIDVNRGAATNESYTLRVTKEAAGSLQKIITRESKHKIEKLDQDSADGLEYLLTGGRSLAYIDEEQATYNS